jgi:pimeloyl-ACP methyl ester carboxylesterase
MIDELAGYAMGVGDWLKRPLVGIAKRVATRKLVKDRGAISDGTSPAAGDILRFLAHGDEITTFVEQAVESATPPVTLVGHSLGGIMCVSLLARRQLPGVERLVTVGSQSGFFYEIGALPGLPYGTELPDHVPAWLNIYDRRDILSYLAAPLFGERVVDVAVDNGQPFPQSHSAYWTNPAVWREIAAFVS